MHRHRSNHRTRLAAVSSLVLGGALAAAGPAWAHTEMQPPTAEAGSTTLFVLYIEDESATAGTSKVELFFPESTEVIVADVPAVEGWEVTVEGGAIGGPATGVTWEGGPEPEDVRMPIELGPLPADAGTLQLKVIQTYDDGTVDRWIGDVVADGPDVENPGPTLEVYVGAPPSTEADDGHDHEHGDEHTTTTMGEHGHEDGAEHDHEEGAATTTTAGDEVAAATDESDAESDSSALPLIIGGVLVVGVAGALIAKRASAGASSKE